MNGSQAHSPDRSVVSSSEEELTRFPTKILLFNLAKLSCSTLTVQDLLQQMQQKLRPNRYVVIFQMLEDCYITEVRKYFELHPIIDTECSNSVLNTKDCFLSFEHYFLLTLSCANPNDDPERPLSLKMIVLPDIMLIFTNGPIKCIDHVFAQHLRTAFSLERELSGISVIMGDQYKEQSLATVEIGPEHGCSDIEVVFHKIIETLVGDLEMMVLRMDDEANVCWRFCNDLSDKEKADLVTRMSLAERQLTYLDALIVMKPRVIKALLVSGHLSEYLVNYMISIKFRASTLHQKLKRTSSILSISEHIFNTTVDHMLTHHSYQLNELMKHFSAVATMFLPLNLIAALWGMNVVVPGQDEDNLIPFFSILTVVALILVVSGVYFKITSSSKL